MGGRGRHDGAGHGVLAVGLRGGGQGQQLALGDADSCRDTGDRVRPLGQGAGFVEEHHVDGAHPLERHPVLDKHPGFRGPLAGDRNDQRNRQAQGVRTGDDQHRDRAHHGIVRAADNGPHHRGDQSRDQREPEQQRRRPIRQGLGPGGGLLGVGNHALDPGQGGVPACSLHPDADGVVGGHGTGDHLVTGVAEDGTGFAGDHRLIEFGGSLDDGSVGRHPGTGPHQHDVVDDQLGDGHGAGGPVNDFLGLIRQQGSQRVKRGGRGPESTHLQPVAQQHDGHQQGQLPPEVQVKTAQPQSGDPGGDKRHGDGHGDQEHHPGLAGFQFVPSALEERRSAVDEDDRAQHRGDPGGSVECREVVAEQVGDHGAENNDGNGQNQRPPEAVPKHCGAVSGVFAVTMNVVVFVQGGVRVIVGHRLAVGVGICVVFVAGMIRVVGVVCFRSGVITMVITGMVGSAHDVPFAQPGRGRDDG